MLILFFSTARQTEFELSLRSVNALNPEIPLSPTAIFYFIFYFLFFVIGHYNNEYNATFCEFLIRETLQTHTFTDMHYFA